jgi:hypothetical protein
MNEPHPTRAMMLVMIVTNWSAWWYATDISNTTHKFLRLLAPNNATECSLASGNTYHNPVYRIYFDTDTNTISPP